MSLDDLHRRLREGAEQVGEGRFRIDEKRALAKLRDHRLADPHHYALELLRAAALSGARRVEVRIDSDDFELTFDGEPFPPAVMRDLLSHALAGERNKDDRRVRLLALGVAGALGLSPKLVKVSSGGVTLELSGDHVEHRREATGRTTFVHVRKRLGWRVVRAALLGSPEEAAIRAHARSFPARLSVNGARVDRPEPFEGKMLASRKATLGKLRLYAAVPKLDLEQSSLSFAMGGVVVCTRPVRLPGLQLWALASCDSFQRNASGSDVVDTDSNVTVARVKLTGIADELLQELVKRLVEKGEPELRQGIASLALELFGQGKNPASTTRKALEAAPILPGPSGEWIAISELRKELDAGRPLKFALRPYPRGSYSPPAVLLLGATQENERRTLQGGHVAALLPATPQVNVQLEVEARQLAVRNHARWERGPVEEPALPKRGFVRRAEVQGSSLRGELGLMESGGASVVRLLCQGKLLEQWMGGELYPLRVLAVVDYQHELPDEVWASPPGPKVKRQLLEAIEGVAVGAILGAVSAPEPTDAALEHGKDLLIRLSRQGRGLSDLPSELRAAPLFDRLGGGRMSIEELCREPLWRHVTSPWPHPLLSGAPVVVLRPAERTALKALGGEELLKDVREQLQREEAVRDRLSGPKEEPLVRQKLVSVPIAAEGMRGEVAIPSEVGNQLSLRLLRDGFLLEECSFSARYRLSEAAVDFPALRPDESWRHAVRDGAFERVIEAVREGERRLCPALLSAFPGPLDSLPMPARRYLHAFLHKQLSGFRRLDSLDEPQRAAAHAPLFRTGRGPRSLDQLGAEVEASGKLWDLEADRAPEHPESMTIVLCDRTVRTLLTELLELPIEDASPELERHRLRAVFRKKPRREARLSADLSTRMLLSCPGLRGEAAFDPTRGPEAIVEVLLEGRPFAQLEVPKHLPLAAVAEVEGLDPAEVRLPASAQEKIKAAVASAERRLIEQSLSNPQEACARELLFFALGSRFDGACPELAGRLCGAKLFPCTDGQPRCARELDALESVGFVTEPMSFEPLSKQPVVVAAEPGIRAGLRRWKQAADVTASMKRELAVRREREQLPKAERILLSSKPAHRRSFAQDGVEGEVGLEILGGRLELFHERRPLCTVSEPALPKVLSAAVSSERLRPQLDHAGVVRDREYEKLVHLVVEQGTKLLAELAERWGSLGQGEQAMLAPSLSLAVARLLREKRLPPKLAPLPLLESTDGRKLSFREVLEQHKRRRRVPFSKIKGSLLRKGRWVWRPRAGEESLFEGTKLELYDATSELEHAAKVRSRPRFEVELPAASRWRERIADRGMEGEVALVPGQTAKGKLVLWLVHQRALLEQVELEHPVGGLARVNCDALSPNASWTKAVRNATYRKVREAVEAALEKALLRLLNEGRDDPDWRGCAEAAAKWKMGQHGPLAERLASLPLFWDLAGSEVTLGKVLAEHSARRSVAIAEVELRPPASSALVLADRKGTRAFLESLKLTVEDVSDDIRRAEEVEASRQARKLERLAYPGDALVRLSVEAGGFRGELALPRDPDAEAKVVLSRSGVAVDRLELGEGLGVAGVLDHPELPVDEEWREATLTPELRAAALMELDRLLTALARSAAGMNAGGRLLAARYALRAIATAGVRAPAHLDRLGGPLLELAGAQLFRTTDGRWVDLKAIADLAQRRGKVPVLKASFLGGRVEGELVLEADDLRAKWLSELEEVLGGRLLRVTDIEEWRREQAEEDPEAGSALHHGLFRLRREMKLLRAGALGQVLPDELAQLRLHRGGGKQPVRYDRARRLALLDPEHPQIARALAEAKVRPDRIYALLAAIYGAVNRELDRITDEHEAQLVSALGGHLAANPELCAADAPRRASG
ncbi:MAG: hypothetical protein HYZ28_05900 [Myxococcales bacterium]|nr:hypothetical protein [Myxococcales bacterium]